MTGFHSLKQKKLERLERSGQKRESAYLKTHQLRLQGWEANSEEKWAESQRPVQYQQAYWHTYSSASQKNKKKQAKGTYEEKMKFLLT